MWPLPSLSSRDAGRRSHRFSRTADRGRRRMTDATLWQRLTGVLSLTGAAIILAWFAVYFSFHQHWFGLVLALAATLLTWIAVQRGRTIARQQQRSLSRALE